jgi:hypothetical protein
MMNRCKHNLFFVGARTRAIAWLATAIFLSGATTAANAGFSIGGAGNFGMLYEGNGGKTLSMNGFTVTGNIGIGGTGAFQGNGPGTINGILDFSAPQGSQFSSSGVTYNPSANNPAYNISAVTSALSTINSLSQSLGLETGTSTTITSGGSISAGSGMLDPSGDRVFTVTSISFPNGTFTINGAATDFVVLNIAGAVANSHLNGSIALNGGITSDHVLFNFTPATSPLSTYNSDYSTLSGGTTMTLSTNGGTTTGIFLDPTADFQIDHTTINGRVFGGGSVNAALNSGAHLTDPTIVPEPSPLLLAGVGLLGLSIARFRGVQQRQAKRDAE